MIWGSMDVTTMVRCSGMIVGLTLLLGTGCQRGPSAPELRDSPVYYNRQEGVRFLVPDGWSQTATSNLPEGDLETEHFLVRYAVRSPESDAQAQVLCVQDKSGKLDLSQHHAQPAFGVEQWTLQEGPTTELIGGQTGTWLYYTGPAGKDQMGKQVLCFRLGDRVYSFVGTFWAKDDKARQSMQRAFQSVIWE